MPHQIRKETRRKLVKVEKLTTDAIEHPASGSRCSSLPLSFKMIPCRVFHSSKHPSFTMTLTTGLLLAACYLAALSSLTHPQALAVASAVISASPQDQSRSSYLNYLLHARKQPAEETHEDQVKLERLLKDTNHSHAGDAVNLQLANSIWQRMHANALSFAQESAQNARPAINRLLEQAHVSTQCKQSLNDLLDHLARLDQWAVEMWNSFGDFPTTGFFEGSLTAMGSYHQCVNVRHNEWIAKPQYCTFKFQPIVPKRPRYHNILAPIGNLANFTSNKDDVSTTLPRSTPPHYTLSLSDNLLCHCLWAGIVFSSPSGAAAAQTSDAPGAGRSLPTIKLSSE